MTEDKHSSLSKHIEAMQSQIKFQSLNSLLGFIRRDINDLEKRREEMIDGKFKDKRSLKISAMNLQNISDYTLRIIEKYPKFIELNSEKNWETLTELRCCEEGDDEFDVKYVPNILQEHLPTIKSYFEDLVFPKNPEELAKKNNAPEYDLPFYLNSIKKHINAVQRHIEGRFKEDMIIKSTAMCLQWIGTDILKIREEFPEFLKLNPNIDWDYVQTWHCKRDYTFSYVPDVLRNEFSKVKQGFEWLILPETVRQTYRQNTSSWDFEKVKIVETEEISNKEDLEDYFQKLNV